MATLEHLEILGIRSFGPQKHQKLSFINPVTLIHGPNGTGKTTVIECLRYATTGDQPPNTKGGAFLFDPKLCDESTIKAQVKLQFRSVTGEQCLVVRSQQASLKGKTITTKTVDTAMKRRLQNGETVAIDSRCADINLEVKNALRVTVPILQNVIFCHQEESNWPLSEGKALKQKFDDIFASAKYVKALDSIAKVRKEKTADIRLKEAGIKLFKVNKDRAEQVKVKKGEAERELQAVSTIYQQVETDLRPVEEKLNKILHEFSEINKVTVALVKKKAEHSHLQTTVNDLKSTIKDIYNGSTAGLKQALAEFKEDMVQKQEQLVNLTTRRDNIALNIEKVLTAEKQLLEEQGSLRQQQEMHKSNVQKRDECVTSMVRSYNVSGFRGQSPWTEDQLGNFKNAIQTVEKSLSQRSSDEKVEFGRLEAELQRQLDNVKQSKTQLEESCRLKRERNARIKVDVRSLNSRLNDVAASSGRLESIAAELQRTESDLRDAEGSLDLASATADVQRYQSERNQQDMQLRDLSAELERAHKFAAERTHLDLLAKDKTEKDEQLRRLKGKVEDTIVDLLGEFPSSQLRRSVEDFSYKLSDGIRSIQKELNQLKIDLNGLEITKAAKQDQLNKLDTERRDLYAKITSVCPLANFEDELGQVQDAISSKQDTRGLYHGIKEMFARYQRMLTTPEKPKNEQKCPLCKRYFEEEAELDELVADLNRQMQTLPARMEAVEKELGDLQVKADRLQQLAPQRQLLSNLEADIPSLRAEIDVLLKSIESNKVKIAQLESDTTMKQDDEESLKGVIPDVIKMDQLQTDSRDLERKITAQNAQMAGLDIGRSMEQIVAQKDDIQSHYDTLKMQLERLQRRISMHNERVQQLRTKVNDLTAEKLSIQEGVQERKQMEDSKLALGNESLKLEQEVMNASDQLPPLYKQIEDLEARKKELSAQKDEKLNSTAAERQQLDRALSNLSKFEADIKRYIDEGKEEKLRVLEDKLIRVVDKLQELRASVETIKREMADINKQAVEQKIRERELEDNLRLREKIEEIAKFEREINLLNEQLGGLDATRLELQKKTLDQQREDLIGKKHTSMERQNMLRQQIRDMVRELESDDYKDAEQIFLKRSIELQVNKMAVTDLDKYHKALDRAILTFHQNKMADLNTIIRKLWKETYRGNDIDYIEICSDAASADDVVEATDITKRRTYNYRVVMVRGGTPMDMRGRCSAGQKVLASLIIRLALAETFCLDCGILALDEPTTNLDGENIESLAHALAEIIKAREYQKNFQLIVITHDTSFVDILAREVGVEEYYKIGKNINGHTELRRANVGDLV